MDNGPLLILLGVLGLIILDIAVLRFGADSRNPHDRNPNWW